MEILYEDRELIVCVKPVGVLSESAEDKNGLVNILKEHTKGEIYPVHRLDKSVGGVMVYAKTKASAAKLSKQVSDRSFNKEYLTVTYGFFEEREGVMEDLLFKDSSKNKTFVVKRERKGVKTAKLSYKVISQKETEKNKISLVKVKLYTGRSHQIRVQFASRKHSLLGDRRYGSKDTQKDIALWSYKIVFFHPIDGKEMIFKKEPPLNSVFFEIFGALEVDFV